MPTTTTKSVPTSGPGFGTRSRSNRATAKPDDGDTFFRTIFVPAFLMLVSPPAVLFVWVVCEYYDGSILSCFETAINNPGELLGQFPTSSSTGAWYCVIFLLMQLLLLLLVPGPTFTAIPTPMGNKPQYKINGVPSFVITHIVLAAASRMGIIRYGALYDHFGPVLAFLGQSALIGTVFLYVRGLYAPTNSDSGPSGYGIIWDMWHGTELHPEILEVSLKQLINCRFAMMGWSVTVIAFAAKQYEDIGFVSNSMLVSTFLQTVYILKFFMWEGGYFNSLDIILDRFGFYIYWGCSAFLPSIYTLASFYLVKHPVVWPTQVAVAMTVLGSLCLLCNYWVDRQRQYFRETNGEKPIWGKMPTYVEAKYKTGDGKERRSKLLTSGWWGMSRHLNYVFEISLAFFWSAPAGFAHFLPYIYVSFLTILLTDRAYRDEIRCSLKYGQYYEKYCSVVPSKMIPGVY